MLTCIVRPAVASLWMRQSPKPIQGKLIFGWWLISYFLEWSLWLYTGSSAPCAYFKHSLKWLAWSDRIIHSKQMSKDRVPVLCQVPYWVLGPGWWGLLSSGWTAKHMGRFLIIWLNIFSSHEGLWDGPEVEWAGGGTGNLSWGVGSELGIEYKIENLKNGLFKTCIPWK